MLKIFKVKGDSLYPLLKNNQLVFTIDVKFFKLKPSDIVVFSQKKYELMVKQIQKIENEKYFLTGTVAHSIDSRSFGFVHKKDIKYKVVFKIGWGLPCQ